ncbi:SCND3 protein, partial [Amia calva]|nr:SCND3 protein [Amia calva]
MECMNAVAETLLDGKQKDELLDFTSSHQHRLLREFLKEVEANANDLLLLSKGRVLERFWSIRKEITVFLIQLKSQKATQFSLFLQDESKMDIVKLIGNFRNRFDSFNLGQQLLLLIVNPFLITDVRGFSKEVTQTFKRAHAGSLQMELIDLQANVALREHFQLTDHDTFWLQAVSDTVFPGLTRVALHTLTMLGSTYSCEFSFSTMNIIKNKYRSRLTNEHLHMCTRMALTPFQPRFKLLAGQGEKMLVTGPL